MDEQKKLPIGEQPAEKKMTIYEYEEKYSRRQNVRGARAVGRILACAVGVFLFTCLFLLSARAYELNEYLGYGVGAASLLLFLFLFLVPTVKIFKTGAFMTNVNGATAKEAKKHNKQLRKKIADHFIEVNAKVEGVGWYDSQKVGELAVAVHQKDDGRIKEILTAIYAKSVKRSSNDIISKAALKSGLYSALSQTNLTDAALITVVNLQMVKDLVFLFGFRPSDAKLAHIFTKVVSNALAAYGMGNIQIGNSVVRTMGGAMKGIPVLGSVISTLVDSSVQGLTNAVLTAVIGYQTIGYLNREYRLQDVLDGVELGSEQELQQTCAELESELKLVGKKPSARKWTSA